MPRNGSAWVDFFGVCRDGEEDVSYMKTCTSCTAVVPWFTRVSGVCNACRVRNGTFYLRWFPSRRVKDKVVYYQEQTKGHEYKNDMFNNYQDLFFEARRNGDV